MFVEHLVVALQGGFRLSGEAGIATSHTVDFPLSWLSPVAALCQAPNLQEIPPLAIMKAFIVEC